jgi:cell division septum initiation protein DivIVA
LSGDETEFATAIRGYDRDAVDEAIRILRKELLQVNGINAQLVSELREKSELLENLQAQLSEVGSPNYASVGTRAALILSTAEEQSLRIVADAEAQRSRVLGDLEEELVNLRAEAKEYYDSLVSEAQRRSERLQSTAKAEYDEILRDAAEKASDLINEATREAGAIRGNIATEAAKLRSTTKRETEAMKADVARKLSEQRLIEFRKLNKEANVAAAGELVSEQFRIDLDLELSGRRAEAEAEYLKKHQEAVAATQKYLDDAQSSLTTAQVRANAARLEAETLEAAAKSVNKRTKDEAREKAEEILVAAQTEARAIVAEAENKARNEVRRLKAAIGKLNDERDAVAIYLKNLRTVVEAAEKSIAE